MDRNNRAEMERFVALLSALAAAKGRNCDEAMLMGFEMGLDDIAIEGIEQAVRESLRDRNPHMPSPGELRELAGDARPEDRAALAWEVVLRCISGVGGYASPNFDDPLINATIRSIGGWTPLCDQTIDQQDRFTRAQFLKTYAGLARTGISDELAAPLIGIADKHNRTHGFLHDESAIVATGLPWAGKPTKRLGESTRTNTPRLELKRP
jgi:hypothetical protein